MGEERGGMTKGAPVGADPRADGGLALPGGALSVSWEAGGDLACALRARVIGLWG